MLPEKIRSLAVAIGDVHSAGQLLKTSTYEFRYLGPDPEQSAVALLMPPRESLTWQDGDLFPAMDQNMPEGDLFMRIRSLFPKQPMTPMHLLALVGLNGIGRLGCSLPEMPAAKAARGCSLVTSTRLWARSICTVACGSSSCTALVTARSQWPQVMPWTSNWCCMGNPFRVICNGQTCIMNLDAMARSSHGRGFIFARRLTLPWRQGLGYRP